VASEMAQFLISNHEKYVPSYGEKNEKTIIQTVPLHGDQLFEERARNTQWTFQDGDTASDKLQGIRTEFADLHAKLNLYMVGFHFTLIIINPLTCRVILCRVILC
jgi:hypothetical protein